MTMVYIVERLMLQPIYVQAVLRLHGSLTTWFSKYNSFFGTLICSLSTKLLLCLHGFLLTWLFFQSQKIGPPILK